MGLLDALQALGCQLKLIQMAPKTKNGLTKIATKSITLKELMIEVDRDTVKALAQTPTEFDIPFEKVFESAGIKPHPTGWNIDRLRQVLLSEKYKAMDCKTVQKSILELLAAEKVEIEYLVKDAVARDQALDAFEGYVVAKIQKLSASRQNKAAEIEMQMQELARQLDRLKEEERLESQRLKEWQKTKAEYDKDLTKTVDLLTEACGHQHPNNCDQKKLV
jgi:hypothetical protein